MGKDVLLCAFVGIIQHFQWLKGCLGKLLILKIFFGLGALSPAGAGRLGLLHPFRGGLGV